jgi:TolB protein
MTSGPYGIWICNPDGNNKRKAGNAESPDWFSDGFRLAGLGLGGEVYLLDTLGNKYEKITNTGQYKTMVAVAPDGKKVVFVQRWNLWSVDTDGSNLKQLTTAGGDWPDWSPDGKWIVYTNGGDKNGHLWLMKPDGNEKHQITF